ncbi:MAG: YHS domain-containing protein [Nitrospira sp. CR1.2]|nr:YHS domain-containing protein [Nitrospira sp. CR1.2]
MYRLFVIAALLALLYYLLRRTLRKLGQNELQAKSRERKESGKQMIQDPVCRVFVPRENAVSETIGGQTYFFCSRNCAIAFQKQLSA